MTASQRHQGSQVVTKTILTVSALLAAFALPAFAGSPPTAKTRTVESVIASCANLGTMGESLTHNGQTGCRNTETGAAVVCGADGRCTEYAPDPRWKKIKEALERSAPKQQAPVRL